MKVKHRHLLLFLLILQLTGCAAKQALPPQPDAAPATSAPTGHMDLQYATQFAVDTFADGAALVTIAGEERYLLVPAGADMPDIAQMPSFADATVLRTPLQRMYLASSGAMDAFRRLNAMDCLRFTSTAAEDWSIEEARRALHDGTLLYAGKYRSPDYELLVSEGCTLAIENTMLFHNPATREQLESLGIPVLVERSSYETHPLGRMEWIKLYGLLTGKADEAEAFFARETAALEPILNAESTGKTVAFFYRSPSGSINVRRPGDYLSAMLTLAGGIYVPAELDAADNALSTVNIQPEAFYAGAKDADVLIYNSNIYPLDSLAQLLAMDELFADFKAVREGNVWCAGANVFQETTAVGGMIADFHAVLSGTASDDLTYLHKLK